MSEEKPVERFQVRTAVPADVDRIAEMGLKFLSTTQYGQIIRGVSVQSMTGFVELLLEIGRIIVVEGKEGLVGMICLAPAINPMSGESEALELAWWMEPKYRGTRSSYYLVTAAEQWASKKGLTCLKMVAPADSNIGGFYERMGYLKVETMYQKQFPRAPAGERQQPTQVM